MAITNDFSTWTQEEINNAIRFINSNINTSPELIYQEALELGLTPDTVAQAVNYATSGSLSGPYTAEGVTNFGERSGMPALTTQPTSTATTQPTATSTTQTQPFSFPSLDEWLAASGWQPSMRYDDGEALYRYRKDDEGNRYQLYYSPYSDDLQIAPQDTYNLLTRFDEQGRPIYGTSALERYLAGGSAAGPVMPNPIDWAQGHPEWWQQLNAAFGAPTYDPVMGYQYPAGYEQEWMKFAAQQDGGFWDRLGDMGPLLAAGGLIAGPMTAAGAFSGLSSLLPGSSGLTEAQIADIIAAEGGYSALPSIGMEGTAISGLPNFAYNPGVFDEFSPFIYDPVSNAWFMPDGITPLTAEGIASTVGTLQNGVFTPGVPNPLNPTNPYLPSGATSPLTTSPNTTPTYTPPTAEPNTTPTPQIPGVNTPGFPTIPGTNIPFNFDLGSLLGSGLSALGQSEMADAYRDIATQYMGIGAPYRDLLLRSYQPGFSMSNEPGYADALQASTNQFLRAASAGNAPGVSGGNPFDNPGAWAETLKYVTSNTALPALYQYRGGLTSAGSLGLPQAVQPAMAGASAQGGVYDSIGYGLGSLFPSPTSQLQTQWMQAMINNLNGGSGSTYRPPIDYPSNVQWPV